MERSLLHIQRIIGGKYASSALVMGSSPTERTSLQRAVCYMCRLKFSSANYSVDRHERWHSQYTSSSSTILSRCHAKCKISHQYKRLMSSVSDDFSIFGGSTNNASAGSDEKQHSIDSLGSWDNRIELPLLMESSIKHGAPIPRVSSVDVGTSSIKSQRLYQEDRYFVKDLAENLLCCAVLDGHGGGECSEFCASQLEEVLSHELLQHKDLQTVLHQTFLTLHTCYNTWAREEDRGSRSGTTATVCLLRNGVELVVGHVGDSRAILCRNGVPRRLTKDHCPSLASERARIEQSGGTVSTDNVGRHMVNGALSMSRSLGDIHLKAIGVVALPDTRSIRVKHGKDAFLLLTTDGINFVLRDEEACNVVNHAQDPSTAAVALTEQALSMSSEDNLTAVIVPFGSWGKFSQSASMFYSFGIGRNMSKSSRFG